MSKPKRKLTPKQKLEKERRRQEFMYVFMNGKQVRVKRPPMIDGIPVDEFIKNNADPIWLHQNEMWELIEELESEQEDLCSQADDIRDPNFRWP
jgi:hypothetical protein